MKDLVHSSDLYAGDIVESIELDTFRKCEVVEVLEDGYFVWVMLAIDNPVIESNRFFLKLPLDTYFCVIRGK